MTTAQLIAFLIGLGAQYGPGLVKDIATLIHGNPPAAGESDADYIARIGAQIDQNTQKVIDQDAGIQKS
jgi:hypothetical protein